MTMQLKKTERRERHASEGKLRVDKSSSYNDRQFLAESSVPKMQEASPLDESVDDELATIKCVALGSLVNLPDIIAT